MKETFKGYLLCFLGVFTWSFSEIMVKLLQRSATPVGPISLSFLRFFFGGLFLLLIILLKKDTKDLFSFLRKQKNCLLMLFSGMVALGISNIIYFVGLQSTHANIGSAIYTTYTIFISIYSIFLLNERTNLPLKFIGYAIGFIGVSILITNFLNLIIDLAHLLGNLLLLLAAAIWAFHSVTGKMLFLSLPEIKNIEIKFTTLAFFLACVPISIALVFSPEINTFFLYSFNDWIIIMLLAIISTGFGLFIFFVGIKKIEVSRGISMALLKPIIATVFAFLILGEIPTIALLISIPLIAIAILLINRPIAKMK
jgi:drug/metabolite transporter (DMT)-like permease